MLMNNLYLKIKIKMSHAFQTFQKLKNMNNKNNFAFKMIPKTFEMLIFDYFILQYNKIF